MNKLKMWKDNKQRQIRSYHMESALYSTDFLQGECTILLTLFKLFIFTIFLIIKMRKLIPKGKLLR